MILKRFIKVIHMTSVPYYKSPKNVMIALCEEQIETEVIFSNNIMPTYDLNTTERMIFNAK